MKLAVCTLLLPGCVIHTTHYEDDPQPPPRRRAHQTSGPAAAPAPAGSPAPAPVPPPAPTPARLTAAPLQPMLQQPSKELPPPSKGDPALLPEGAATGRPPGFRPGAVPAFWIWQGPRGGWRIRTTTLNQPHEFRGRIRGLSGAVANVHPSRTEFRDRVWRFDDGSWGFSFKSQGHADGFTFITRDNGCVAFDLLLDGGPQTKRIFVGAGETEPPGSYFVVCPKGMKPPPPRGLRLPGG